MKNRFKPLATGILLWLLVMPVLGHAAEKPRIWVITDLLKGPLGDEDDDVCMGALLLLADHYTIEGISVGANPKTVEGTDVWAKETFVADYKKEVGRLNAYYDDQYQLDVPVIMADSAGLRFAKISSEAENPDFLETSPSIMGMVDAAEQGSLFVLNWGPLTEVAMLLKYCVTQNKIGTLKNISIISHWTQRGGPWNCGADNAGCNYVHDQAEANPNVVIYELGPSGQRGLVENITNETAVFDREAVFASKIGQHMNHPCGKCEGMPDMSDGSTMLVLMGFGGGLDAYNRDGTMVTDQDGVNRLLCRDRGDFRFTGRVRTRRIGKIDEINGGEKHETVWIDIGNFECVMGRQFPFSPGGVRVIDIENGINRRVPLHAPSNVRTYYHLAVELLRRYWDVGSDGVKIQGDNLEFVTPVGELVATVPMSDGQFLELN